MFSFKEYKGLLKTLDRHIEQNKAYFLEQITKLASKPNYSLR